MGFYLRSLLTDEEHSRPREMAGGICWLARHLDVCELTDASDVEVGADLEANAPTLSEFLRSVDDFENRSRQLAGVRRLDEAVPATARHTLDSDDSPIENESVRAAHHPTVQRCHCPSSEPPGPQQRLGALMALSPPLFLFVRRCRVRAYRHCRVRCSPRSSRHQNRCRE